MDKFFTSTRSSLSNSLLNYQTNNEELGRKTAAVTTQQQRELLRFLTQRGPVKQSEAKIVPLDIHTHEDDEGISNSTIANIENRLLEAALMPIKSPAKLVMDIGTQSSDYLFSKDLKSPTDVAVSIPVIPTNFISNETGKSPAVQFNQFQKIAESDVKSSAILSSFMNLDSSTTAVPTTSSSFSINAITKQFPAKKSSTNVPETVALSQEQPNDITFSFKNLDAPLTAKSDVSSRETDSCTVVTPSKSDYISTVAQKVFTTKSSENQATSIVPATTSESLTNTSVTTASSSTTITEIGRASIQNSENSKTGKEMAVTNSSSASTTTSKTSNVETNISFTFKLPEAENQQTASSPAGGGLIIFS
ncbi:unnamed protein product [Onchocerca flexuosa]|uniref:Flocculation protein FLO11-like n=1 Tax=Onchocerca flexuosa TaxID=387005 RepID=A0A183HCC6_9BILA|nr:unnamed protein product [Onchocerca flexuosa]